MTRNRCPARTRAILAALLALVFAFLPAVARADPAAPAFTANGRPRIGLVLSGGGAKGFAHIGVIEELERRHIPVDVISGTSMGAVVGSMYAIGNDAAQIKAIASSIDWVSVFNDRHDRRDLSFRRKREVRDILLDARLGIVDGKVALPRGVLGGQRLFATVQEILAPWRATQDFDRLPIPFRAVATDIVTGDAVAMGSGNLSTAVFASMSIPAAFPPVKRDGLLLVDGMIADNLPVDVARAMGVDVIIAVDVGQPPRASADDITNAIDVFSQMQSLLGWASIKRQRASMTGRDVLIDPDITGLSVTGFTNYALGIERGRAAARKMGDKLAALAVSDAQWAEYLAQRRARTDPSPIVIDKVRIVNTSTLPTRMLEPMITTRPGETLDGSRMARDVTAIFKLDEFERVDYSVDFGASGNTLVVNALGGRASEKYFMAGALLTTNFGKTSTFDLALGYTDRNFLGTGAEWRGFARVGNDVLLDVSLYKQFGRAFVEPIAYYQKYSSEIVRQGSQEAGGLLQVHGGGAGIDGGWVFGNWGEFRLGFRLGGINPTEQGLDIGIPPGWITDTDWRAGFTVDTLDSLNFPRSGTFAQLQFVDHIGVLGGKFRRETLGLNVQKPHSFGETTIVFGGRLGTTTRAVNDYLGDYALGGFLNMSGLRRNSLIGQQLLFGRAVAFHRISSQAPILDLPVYIGGSLEAGNVWGSTSDISLSSLRTAVSGFIAADTPLGPLWLAVGQSRSDTSVYLVLGRVF